SPGRVREPGGPTRFTPLPAAGRPARIRANPAGEHPMDRGNQYEAAFEAYLRERRLAYIAVDEAKRATLGDEPAKRLDFIVHRPDGPRLLIDVKGRRYPGGSAANPRRVWENWSTQDDISG